MGDQLEGNEEEHMKYRAMVVEYIVKHREEFEPFIEDEVPFEEYCDSMLKDGTWAGHMELQAASLLTRRNICIHMLNSPRWYINNFSGREATNMVHLSYHHGEHYNSVRLREDPCQGPAMPVVIKTDANISNINNNTQTKAKEERACGSPTTTLSPARRAHDSTAKMAAASPPPPRLLLRLLTLALALAGAAAGKISAPRTPISRDIYHSSDSLLREIKALVARHSDKLSMDTIRTSNKGYSAELFVVTFNHMKESVDNGSKVHILLSFGQHGRELITSEVALHLLYILTEKPKIAGVDLSSFEKLLENLVIKVVPMENMNGRKRVEEGELCDRRNGRGVDLNRNWSVDWGMKEKDYDPYEENPGIAPFSEPEAQIMRELSRSFKPHIWVNVHSGMEALFMPYDHKNTTPNGASAHLMWSVLENLNRRHFQDSCLVGSGGGSVGYLAHGTTTDYMYDIAKVPMPFTFEIYGDEKASTDDCFKMFNPVDKKTFDRVINKWCMAFLILFEEGLRNLRDAQIVSQGTLENWVPIGGDIVEINVERKSSRDRRKLEGLDLGMQELRTYFRLFLLSTFLLMFMFCTRISKNRNRDSGNLFDP